MKRPKKLKLLSLVAFLCAITICSNQAFAQQAEGGTKTIVVARSVNIGQKIDGFLKKWEQSKKHSERVWSVTYNGKSIGEFPVFLATVPDSELFIIGAVVAKKENVRFSQELLYQLLKYNHRADYVKVGIDDQGDIFVRTEVNGRLIDEQEFKVVLEQVAAASNQVHAQMKDAFVTPSIK